MSSPASSTEASFSQCVRCGACTAVCPVYRRTGQESHSARGKMLLLAGGFAEKPDRAWAEILGHCLMCGACAAACPRKLPLLDTYAAARAGLPPGSGTRPRRRRLLRGLLASPRILRLVARLGIGLARLQCLPPESGLWRKLGLPPLTSARGRAPCILPFVSPRAGTAERTVHLFAGCLARYLQPEVTQASRLLAHRAGFELNDPDGQSCCGLAAWSAGDLAGAKTLARRTIALYRELPGTVATPCASCLVQLGRYGQLLADEPQWAEEAASFSARVRSLYELLPVETGSAGAPANDCAAPALVYHHESCHLRHHPGLAAAPRRLLESRIDISLLPPAGPDLCCGQGGLFQQVYPALAQAVFAPLWQRLRGGDIELVLTSCSGCLLQWQTELAARGSGVSALHLAVFLAQGAGDAVEKPCCPADDLLKLTARGS